MQRATTPAYRHAVGFVAMTLGFHLVLVGLLATPAVAADGGGEKGAGTGGGRSHDRTPAQLAIALNDGVGQVRSGQGATYTTEVTNLGSKVFRGTVVLAVPTFVTFASVAGARLGHGTATWTVAVRPGRTVQEKVTVRVADVPPDVLRVMTVASAFKVGAKTPVVRTADADTVGGRAAGSGTSGRNWVRDTLVGVAVVIIGGIGVALLPRRRGSRTGRGRHARPDDGVGADEKAQRETGSVTR